MNIEGGVNISELRDRLLLESKKGVLGPKELQIIQDAIDQNAREHAALKARNRGSAAVR